MTILSDDVSDVTILNTIMVVIDDSRGIKYDQESSNTIVAEWHHSLECHSRDVMYNHRIFVA